MCHLGTDDYVKRRQVALYYYLRIDALVLAVSTRLNICCGVLYRTSSSDLLRIEMLQVCMLDGSVTGTIRNGQGRTTEGAGILQQGDCRGMPLRG